MIYEYLCPNHGTIEIQQSIKEKFLKYCPYCKPKVAIKKLISLCNFKLVGEGWSKTDLLDYKASQIEKRLEQEDHQEDVDRQRFIDKKGKEIEDIIKKKLTKT